MEGRDVLTGVVAEVRLERDSTSSSFGAGPGAA